MIQGGSREASISFSKPAAALVRHRRVQSGFTITEVMIVLAITGLLSISAIAFISGRQAKTQFTTGINGLQQQLQQVIDDTVNGFYPKSTAFTCSRGSSTPPVLTPLGSAGDHQGQNPDCLFLGKVIQFGVQGANPDAYHVFPIVGNRLDTTAAAEASTLYGATGAYPEAAAQGTTTNTTLTTGADNQVSLTQGMQVISMWYNNSTANLTSTVGFISSLPSLAGGNLASGTQQVGLYTVPTTRLNQSALSTADQIFTAAGTTPLAAVGSVEICVKSGSTNQLGKITIGSSDSASATGGLAVSLAIQQGASCT